MALASRITRFSSPPAPSEKFFDDNRFRALLPPEAWGRLPVATWRRFSKKLGAGRTIVYAGEIEEAQDLGQGRGSERHSPAIAWASAAFLHPV